ncbi:MAG: hypothetical protein Q605_AUC00728G0003 [Actinomyces urogenitalis DORA_12]|uniref:Uncharacterized protein n=1 Tax=Actinomyces urogenitalis DORA_12 TaxID=1403939 RepID=W1VJF6_9ACTO|nr:MAG: hypothetical protein Q605_AUC00728G0003 [Actinomyces urogenitalis DORA_12]
MPSQVIGGRSSTAVSHRAGPGYWLTSAVTAWTTATAHSEAPTSHSVGSTSQPPAWLPSAPSLAHSSSPVSPSQPSTPLASRWEVLTASVSQASSSVAYPCHSASAAPSMRPKAWVSVPM